MIRATSRRPDSSMLILCPHCATSYRVESSSLGDEGRSVRCTRCQTVWFAAPERLPAPPVAHQHNEMLASELASAAQALATGREEMPEEAGMGFPAPPEAEPMPDYGEPADAEAGAESRIEAVADTLHPAPIPPEDDLPAAQADEPAQVDESPSIVPPIEQLATLPTSLPDPHEGEDDVESFAARRERLRARRRKPKGRLPSPGLPVVILVLIAVVGGLIGWRKTIVRVAPQTASLYARIGLPVNLRGLVFGNIKTTRETQDGIPVLVVEGTIGSKSSGIADVPRLRFAVRNAAGVELYTWTAMPSRQTLGPGEQLPFRSRLASPPTDAQEVTVRFFNRYDAGAGMR